MLLSLGKVLKCLFVPLPLLPCDVNKFVLIRNHIPLVLFFYLVQHLVLVKPVEAPCLLSSFLSVEQTIHDDRDGLGAGFAGVAVECHLFELGLIPDLLPLELFLMHFSIEFDLGNFLL